MMVLYNLINDNKCSIKEILIYTDEWHANEIFTIWENNRKYINEVLKYIKVYKVNEFSLKQEIIIKWNLLKK